MHLVAFHPGHRFGDGDLGQLLHKPLENTPPDFGVRHLAAAEEDRRLDLVAVLEEALDMLLLELVVVLVDLRPELDLLDQDHLLVLLRFARALLLLVLILPEVHDAADRRHGGRRDLDQVESLLLRYGQGLRRRHDAELLPGVVDDPDFPDADAFVHPGAVVAPWTAIESDKSLLTELRSARCVIRPNWAACSRLPAAAFRDLGLGRGHEGVDRAAALVAARSCTHRYGAFRHFPVPDHQHVGDLLKLGLSNLISNLFLARVHVRPGAAALRRATTVPA